MLVLLDNKLHLLQMAMRQLPMELVIAEQSTQPPQGRLSRRVVLLQVLPLTIQQLPIPKLDDEASFDMIDQAANMVRHLKPSLLAVLVVEGRT